MRPDTRKSDFNPKIFQSTHPLRGATVQHPVILGDQNISIHAPLAGGDFFATAGGIVTLDFNPRTPCGVRRVHACSSVPLCNFNPRTPCGVRQLSDFRESAHIHFNPRAPCGARLIHSGCRKNQKNFNPRAPCGARLPTCSVFLRLPEFQSTRPMRGATEYSEAVDRGYRISIHAPHAGRD